MKYKILIMTALMAGAVGCSVNDLEVEQEEPLKIVFAASPFEDGDKAIDTKTSVIPNESYSSYEFIWSAKDTVGIYPDVGSQIYFTMENGAGASSASFDGGAWTCKEGHTFRSYYPFIGTIYLDATQIPVSFTGQKQVGNDNSDHFQKYDYMYTAATTKEGDMLNFAYNHLITAVLPWVELPAGHYTGIKLSLDEAIFVTKGEYSLVAETPAIVGKQFSNEIDVELDVTFNTADILKVYVPLAPLDMSGKTLTITVTDENDQAYQYTYNPSKAYEAGKIYRLRSPESFADPIISFADNAVKAICVARWDTNNDGELSISEAAAVTSIPYSAFAGNTTITSFDEFQYFTGVSSLGYHSEYDDGMDYYGTFSGCTALTSITLPSTLQTISYGCFRGCTGLTEITIPASVTTIQQVAFLGCTNLDVYMESEVPCALQNDTYGTYNEPYSFGFLTSGRVKTIYVPTQECVNTYKTATYWSSYASIIKWVGDAPTPIDPSSAIVFADEAVKALCVARWDSNGDGELSYEEASLVSSMGFSSQNTADYGPVSFNELKYFTGLKRLNNYAFRSWYNLESITLPEGLETIGYGAFQNCEKLSQINFPSSLSTLDSYAFRGCSELKRVDLSDIMTWFTIIDNSRNSPFGASREGHLFITEEEITEIIVPRGISDIKAGITTYCINFSKITLNEDVTSFSMDNIGYVSNICIDVPSLEYWISSVYKYKSSDFSPSSWLLSVNGVEVNNLVIPNTISSIGSLCFSYCSSITNAIIPSSIGSQVPQSLFSGCINLSNVIIPNDVTSIEPFAFAGCRSLTSIDIPEGVTRIGGSAFSGCSSLMSIDIPGGVTSVETNTFYGCSSLTSIVIPENVTSIGNSAFSYCSGLISIIVNAIVPPSGGNNMFNNTNCPIYVPAESVDAYTAAQYWSDYASRIRTIPE